MKEYIKNIIKFIAGILIVIFAVQHYLEISNIYCKVQLTTLYLIAVCVGSYLSIYSIINLEKLNLKLK